MSVNPRLNRLFNQSGKCIQVALDHAVANEPSTLPGMENMKQVVGIVAAANPDAIILTLGQAHWLQDLEQKPKPALVVRADAMNVFTVPISKHAFCKSIDEAVEQAVALDAAAIVVNLYLLPEQPDLHRQCLENVVRFKPQCDRYGMPLMVEPMVLIPDDKGGFKTHSDIRRTVALARQAVELGADIIKADIDANIHEYHLVVEACSPRPLLPRGGSRVPDQEILTRTYMLLQQGASGVVYGRNVYQHPHPERMVRALQAIVHEGATVAQAQAILE
jgi:DhnA family fructose-bisphosphate aldolase class Ia